MSSPPLILTLGLHPEDQSRFEALRQRHFPPAHNHIPAHLTLFHHLPGDEAEAVTHSIQLAASAQPGFSIEVTGLRSLGRGVAYTLASPTLTALRATIARLWHGSLTTQDRQGWRPHITIQNKVPPPEAAALLATMTAAFTPLTIRAESLLLWHYQGGPWTKAGEYPLASPSPSGRGPG